MMQLMIWARRELEQIRERDDGKRSFSPIPFLAPILEDGPNRSKNDSWHAIVWVDAMFVG